jgi:Mor family transcriptional regulator
MKDDAFDDLRCPFNYKKELEAAREALNKKLIECVSRPWGLGYRELAKKFNISAGTLFAIAQDHKKKQKPGPRRYTPKGP